MTKYTVLWVASARDELTSLWLKAENRKTLTHSTHLIDQMLSIDPETRGYQIDNYRTLSIKPLSILFEIFPDDRIVKVLEVRLANE